MTTVAAPVAPDLQRGATLPALAVRGIAVVAGIKLLLQLAFLTPYGWHRDEFYYLVGGRQLDGGYVDHPMLVPWVARAIDAVVGPSLIGLRIVPALLGTATVVLTALIARELGGGRAAQIVAALCVALDPALFAMNHWFQTPSFDVFAWVAATYCLARLLRTGDERWWLGVGAAAAFGLLSKVTIVVWLGALLVGILATPARRHLRSRWFAVAVGITALAALPFVWFQLQHDWAFLEFTRNMNARTGGEEQPLFVPGQILLHDPVSAIVWIPGLWALFRFPELRRYRAFGWAYAVAFAVFFATAGKVYYLTPAYPVLFAAGATYLATRRQWLRVPRGLVVALVIGTLLALPGVLPVLPVDAVKDSPYAGINEDMLEQVGWPELVATVERVVEEQPGRTVVLTGNYGEAGALEVLGNLPERGVPVWSGQNSYWLWGGRPTPTPGTSFVTIGIAPAVLDRSFTDCAVAATIDNDAGVENEERHEPVTVCRGLRRPWSETWDALRHYS